MLDAELLLAHLTEREFRYWQQIGEPIRVRAGETLVDVGEIGRASCRERV